MSAKETIFRETLTKKFDINAFTQFTRELLVNTKLIAPDRYVKVFGVFQNQVEGYYHIANYIGSDDRKVAIICVELKKDTTVVRARSMQRNFVKKLIEDGNCDAALAAFYQEDDSKWRLSFVKLDYEFVKGKTSQKITPAKRSSYLVGDGEPSHTAMSRLFPIFIDDISNPSIVQLEEAFSVEAVTNEFFKLYTEKYHDLREWLDINENFISEAELHNFDSIQFSKKLMGQIVFLYFLQKKGWLGVNAIPKELTEKQYKNAMYSHGQKSKEMIPKVFTQTAEGTYKPKRSVLEMLSEADEEFIASCVKGADWGDGPKNFMRLLFNECIKQGKNYFDDYLEPLFYSALNENRGANGYFVKLHSRVPFLNGGLFEQLDNYDWENNNFEIPNEMFSNAKGDGILDVFDRYNFTIKEDEPLEKEVAIDPEMLGKIFENLLDITDRKSKGAFYTPREIVHYMCQESLVNYLVVKTGIPYGDMKDFILYADFMKDEDTEKSVREGNKEMLIPATIFAPNKGVDRLLEIDNALANIHVVDPAVGSGAFPLGMLNEIVRIRDAITGYMRLSITDSIDAKILYAYTRHPYKLKIETIRNCIFAVDIEPSAVDIAKLRLWLSLVIDDEIVTEYNGLLESLNNPTPTPLPNLDCNIICANSLIDEFEGIKLINTSELFGSKIDEEQIYFGHSKYEELLNQLFDAQTKLFKEDNHYKKEQLKKQIQNIKDTLIMFNIKTNTKTIEKYNTVKHHAALPYCLWGLEFGKVFKEKGGFDIVIGNPPYVRVQNLSHEIIDVYKNRWSTAWKRIDISTLFMELGYSLINSQGAITYISSNQFITTEYGRMIRKFLTDNAAILKMVDFGDLPVFENALTYVSIFFLSKIRQNGFLYTKVDKLPFSDNHQFDTCSYTDIDDNVWSLGNKKKAMILEKMRKGSEPLSNYAKCWAGVITGNDDLLMYDIDTAIDTIEEELILPVVRAQGCERFKYATPSKKIFYPYKENNDNTELLSLDEIKRNYPKAYSFIMHHSEELKSRKDSRKTFGDKKGWYGLVRFGKLSRFKKEKIVSPGEVKNNKFSMDVSGAAFSCARVFSITVENDNMPIKALLGILNSKLIEYYLHNVCSLKQGGYYSYSSTAIDAIPLRFDINSLNKISELAASVLIYKIDEQVSTSPLESQIDDIVYLMYGISLDEKRFIENSLMDSSN